jgi:hypothetical protein
VSNAQAVEAAHVSGGAGGNEHVACVRFFGWGVEVQQVLLRLKEHTVPGLLIDLDLRMIWSHVALCASAGQPGDPNGTDVAGMTRKVPIVPPLFGLPTLWHCSQPLVLAAPPSSCTKGCGGRRVPPG